MLASISPRDLIALQGTDRWPVVVNVVRRTKFDAEPRAIAGSVWRDHMATETWGPQLGDGTRPLVVYCAHGHNVSQLAAARLRAIGIPAYHVEGGVDGFEAAGGTVLRQFPAGFAPDLPRPTEWVTRRRPKIDRIACPWLIRRFIDPFAVFHFVDAEWVVDIAREIGGHAFDVPDVTFTHRDGTCTFDTLISEFGLAEPALARLALIVRGADTGRLDLAPQAAGLLAVSLGLSVIHADDNEQLEHGLGIYDALYGWLRHAADETHSWTFGEGTR